MFMYKYKGIIKYNYFRQEDEMDYILILISLVIMLIGFLGVFIPAVPGAGLIFLTALIYSFVTGFEYFSILTIVILGLLTLLTIILDNVTALITTKKVGASIYGIVGAIIGGLIGFLIFNIVGVIIGQFLGAMIGELLIKKEFKDSFKVGLATFFGYLLGIGINSTIAIVMIVIFVLNVIL